MNFETLFSIAGVTAMTGWLFLLFSPLIPKWSNRIAGTILPVILSLGYFMLLIMPSSDNAGGFGTLAVVMELFSYEQAALAGLVHFLAFDLFVGAWACRTTRVEGVSFWQVALCLPMIFLFGPAGLLPFQAIRALRFRIIRTKVVCLSSHSHTLQHRSFRAQNCPSLHPDWMSA